MIINILGKNITLTQAIKDLVNEKIDSLSKHIRGKDLTLAEARVEVGLPSRHHQTGMVYYAEINLSLGGKLLRASEEHMDLNTAVIQARDEIKRQLQKEKDKQLTRRRKG